ncbi:MAG TPA: DUF2267 domain-containing protein [Dongiaceae bacterium]|jgi:uncharacterized protein (DUF2267 family)|nr:DUF2267 domain-containing protein [Dongiaceae bacterium]
MSGTGLPVIDKTIQETNLWLKALMNELGTEDRHDAYGTLKAVLHALRDRIGPENAVHLGAQLPLLVRGIYYEGWHPATTPTHERHIEPFLEHLRDRLPLRLAEYPERAARAVFNVMWQKIDQGEVAKVIEMLPTPLRQLWESVEA